MFDTHTREWSVACYRCGFSDGVEALRERGGKRPTKATRWSAPIKRYSDGFPMLRRTTRFGSGAYVIARADGYANMGTYSRPVTDDQVEAFRRTLEKPGVDPDSSYLSAWREGALSAVVGTIPGAHTGRAVRRAGRGKRGRREGGASGEDEGV